jgi:hypothetical protein
LTQHQNEDGRAHLAYFDKPHQLSFIWDCYDPVIQVCYGGYGEPVTDTIEVTQYLRDPKSPATTATRFEVVCMEYVKRYEASADVIDIKTKKGSIQ